MQSLPNERKNWRVGSLNQKQKKDLYKLVDHVMLDDPEYGNWTKLFTTYRDYYESLYGHSKNNKKNIAYKKWLDMRSRVGNALLSDLRRMDKRAEYYREKINIHSKNANNFCEEVVRSLQLNRKKKKVFSKHRPLGYISRKHYQEKHDEWRRIQEHRIKKKKDKYKEEKKLKKNAIRPIIRKATANQLYSRMQAVFDKEMTSKDKQQALLEYEQLNQSIEHNQLEQ